MGKRSQRLAYGSSNDAPSVRDGLTTAGTTEPTSPYVRRCRHRNWCFRFTITYELASVDWIRRLLQKKLPVQKKLQAMVVDEVNRRAGPGRLRAVAHWLTPSG